MKIINVTFENLKNFKNEKISIDFFATDRVVDKDNNHHIANSIYTQKSIAFVGINATGKTTLLRLLESTLRIVIDNNSLNNINNNFIKDNTIMSIIFFYKNNYYKLESTIGSNEKSDMLAKKEFYYKEEKIYCKNKASVKTKKAIYDFPEDCLLHTRTSLAGNNLLKDDTSIVILITKDLKMPVMSDIDNTNINILRFPGITPHQVSNVFDDNIEYMAYDEGSSSSCVLKFKNSDEVMKIDEPLNVCKILSSGTIKGQNIMLCVIFALQYGSYVFIDELENHLNKELVKMILNLFNDSKTNPKGACIIFSTHYIEILDSIERKDNIFVCRKKSGLIDVFKYSDKIVRNDLKKSEMIITDALEGTAPQYEAIEKMRRFVCSCL